MSTPFTAGTDGYHTYRIPALAVTGGAVLAACEGRKNSASDTGDIDIVLKRSTDGGQTWQPLQNIQSHGTDTAANPTVVAASGDVLLLSCRQGGSVTSYDIRTGAATPRTVYVQRSSDAGATWSPKSDITSQVRASWMRGFGTGPGHGVALTSGTHAGRLVVPCWHTRTPSGTDTGAETKHYGAHAIYSDDGGTTWAIGAVSSTADGVINENESTTAELPDGRLYFTCRRLADDSPGYRADTYSSDAGGSFDAPYRVQVCLPLPSCQGSVITLPDGRLVHSGPLHPDERAGLGLWVSGDEGATWGLAHRITGRLAAYSALAVDDADLLVLYETGDAALYERIDLVRVPLTALS